MLFPDRCATVASLISRKSEQTVSLLLPHMYVYYFKMPKYEPDIKLLASKLQRKSLIDMYFLAV